MRIACVGAGPAALYFAISAKLRDPGQEITVFERNPRGVTYGWGVTFSDDLLDLLYRNDPHSARAIAAAPGAWNDQEVHVDQRRAHLGGYGFAIDRTRLLDVLTERAVGLGVDVRFDQPIRHRAQLAFADLVVGADGVHSWVRTLHPFGTEVLAGANCYLWLGTDRMFPAFRFAFESTPAGWIWFYSYPYDADRTTFIVECSAQTCQGLGLATAGTEQGLRTLQALFARHLGNSRLHAPAPGDRTLPWQQFGRLTTTAWHRENTVLIGDAAHTTHFSVGSGTTLAIGDAVALADCLHRHAEVGDALSAYENQRRPVVADVQVAAARSETWFADLAAHVEAPITRFSYELWARRGTDSPWRYRLHLATQVRSLRVIRRSATSARCRWRHQRRLRVARGSSA
jgi:anthraniloyl-CoA monooxygenase